MGSRRSVDSTSSLLHSPDGTAVYINRYIAPGAFDRNEFQSEINEGDHKIIAKGARATRKRTARKKAIRPQAENSQPDGKNPDEGIGTTGHPALNEVPKESNTAVLKT